MKYKDKLSFEKIDGNGVGIIYLHGWMSSKNSKKGQLLKKYALQTGRPYFAFDAPAHGLSDGNPAHFTLSNYITDALDIVDALLEGPYIIVGSSMGGWIGLCVAEQRKNCILGFVGLAAAPDFSIDIWQNLLSDEHKKSLKTGETLTFLGQKETTYTLTQRFFDDAATHAMLNRTINYDKPVILIQGDADKLVSPEKPFQIAKQLLSNDVEIRIIKNAGHSLTAQQEPQSILSAIDLLLSKVE